MFDDFLHLKNPMNRRLDWRQILKICFFGLVVLWLIFLLSNLSGAQEEIPAGEELSGKPTTSELFFDLLGSSEPPAPMGLGEGDVLYDYWNTGDDMSMNFDETNQLGQTFTATTTYIPVAVRLKMFKTSAITTVYLHFYATEGEQPTSTPLCTATLTGDDIPTDVADWVEFTFSDCSGLNQSTMYALVCHTSEMGGDPLNWRVQNSDAYAGGSLTHSDGQHGVMGTWSNSTRDCMFEIYGAGEEPPVPPTTSTDTIILIQNTTTGAFFYLDRTITYGDCLIFFILLLILLLFIIKFIFNLEIPRRISGKKL